MELYAGDEEQRGKRSAAIRHSYEDMIRHHEDEPREYHQSVVSELILLPIQSPDDIALFNEDITMFK